MILLFREKRYIHTSQESWGCLVLHLFICFIVVVLLSSHLLLFLFLCLRENSFNSGTNAPPYHIAVRKSWKLRNCGMPRGSKRNFV